MKTIAKAVALFVALSHVGIFVLEMFFWNHPTTHRIFSMTPEFAAASDVMAMNQGLYNGFLVAGLFWGLLKDKFDVIVFFLACVVVAAVFGAATVKTSILFAQGAPALIALIAVLMSRSQFKQN